MTGVMKRAIKGWLKAGVMEGKYLFPTEEGTPQGGVISPLLANIALHGMENAIAERWPNVNNRPKIVRYADDLVTIHVSLPVVIECVELLDEWLMEGGLQLHPDKTRIVHTLDELNGQPPGSYSMLYTSANFGWESDTTRTNGVIKRSSAPVRSLKRSTRTTSKNKLGR